MHLNRDVQRMQQVCEYVMAHYVHPIALNDITSEVGMNRSAFCIWFKRYKGMAFSKFLTQQYRLHTACELLKHSHKSVSEIGYLVSFNDIPHFNGCSKKKLTFPLGSIEIITQKSCKLIHINDNGDVYLCAGKETCNPPPHLVALICRILEVFPHIFCKSV